MTLRTVSQDQADLSGRTPAECGGKRDHLFGAHDFVSADVRGAFSSRRVSARRSGRRETRGTVLARDALHGRRRYIVFARRRGSAAPSANGIDGLLSAVRLLGRAVRRDHRYEILVWDRESYPGGQPTSVEVVPDRGAATARVEQLARDIQDGGVIGN